MAGLVLGEDLFIAAATSEVSESEPCGVQQAPLAAEEAEAAAGDTVPEPVLETVAAEPVDSGETCARAADVAAPCGSDALEVSPMTGSAEALAAAAEAAGELAVEVDYSAEPLEARFDSKDLGRRCSAYAEAQSRIQEAAVAAAAGGAAVADVEAELLGLMRRHFDTFLAESLPKGQDSALSALAAFLEHWPSTKPTGGLGCEDVLALVRRLVEHKAIDRPKMQTLSLPIVLLVAEICEVPAVVKEIMDGLIAVESAKKKTQGFLKKQIAFALRLICSLLADFGVAKMSPKLGFLGLAIKYVADSDRAIREACYSIFLELSAWIGDIADPMKPMAEPQKKELQKRLSELGEQQEPRQAKRFYRGEKPQEATAVSSKDKFGIFDAVDALKELPKGWCVSKVFAMEKWKDKQTYLQMLSSALQVTRLAPNDAYATMAANLVRLIKSESNIPVVTEATKCVGLMAKGLRKDFERSARMLLPVAIGRISDKSVWRPNVLVELVEQLLWSVPYEALFEELRPSVASKSLFVKKEAMSLLLRALDLPQVQLSCPNASQLFFKVLVTTALPNIDDSDNTVRHETSRFLAVLVQRNAASAAVVLDRLPATRRSSFEEEWRKVSSDAPCPTSTVGLGSSLLVASAAAGGGGGPSVEPEDVARPPAAGAKPLLRAPSPRCGTSGTQHGATRAVPSRPASPRPITDGARSVPTPHLVAAPPLPGTEIATAHQDLDIGRLLAVQDEMAEEIRNLRNAVQMLQQENQAAGGYLTPGVPRYAEASCEVQAVAVGQRMRRPSQLEQRFGAKQETRPVPTALTSGPYSARAQLVEQRASTPTKFRAMTPDRQRTVCRQEVPVSPDHATLREWTTNAAAEPRLSTASAKSGASSPPRPASTARRGTVRAPGHEGATRPSSSDSRICPATSNVAGLRRSASSALSVGAATGSAVELRLCYPRQAKLARQAREKSQYWGPESIPAEHLLALKEAWKAICVDELGLLRAMFAERMEDQLAALQSWRRQAKQCFQDTCELLDLLLKWLTWLLFNPNTQIWKAVLDFMSGFVDDLIAKGEQLNDREAQILVPNLLERSGHNMGSIRDAVASILQRVKAIYPRIRLLPMFVHGLNSKSKRSAASAMRALGESLDRQVAIALVRSQREWLTVSRMADDKDPDCRRAALHTIVSLAAHLDGDSFERALKVLSPAAQGAVRGAVGRVHQISTGTPEDLDTSYEQQPPASAVVAPRRSTQSLRLASPQRVAPSHSTVSSAQAPAQPPPLAPAVSAQPITSSQVARSASMVGATRTIEVAAMAERPPMPSPITIPASPKAAVPLVLPANSPVPYLVDQLSLCSAEDFKANCALLVDHLKRLTDCEAVILTEALVSSMRMYFGHGGCADRCRPLAGLIDEFCSSKDCVRPLPDGLVKGLLRELMRNLHDNVWTKQVDQGDALLRMLNLSCVMLLQSLSKHKAVHILLTLGMDESEVVGDLLAVKCLKKISKTFANSRTPEQDIFAVLDAIHAWLNRAQPRLSRAPMAGSVVDNAVHVVVEGARAAAEAAQRASPETARAWALQSQERGRRGGIEESMMLRQWVLAFESGYEKENSCGVQNVEAIEGKVASLVRRLSSSGGLQQQSQR